jgi:hypothetical protein
MKDGQQVTNNKLNNINIKIMEKIIELNSNELADINGGLMKKIVSDYGYCMGIAASFAHGFVVGFLDAIF